jgi:hypothetical protein
MVTITGRKSPLVMPLKVEEHLQLSQFLPTRLGPALWGQTHHSAANQVDTTAPSGSGQKMKCVMLAPKRKPSKPSADQVMTQIELPPYHRLQSPLDLITVEIIFGCLFEAFQHASQAVGTGTSAGDDISFS